VDVSGPLGLDDARALDPARHAIGGRPPRIAVRPGSRDEVVEALRAAARDRLAIVPWGGGTALPREAAPERYDVALDLTALNGVAEYEPEDLTITAGCGITLESLALALRARGQELPIEGAHAGRATLGGALVANASGPRRLRFGSPRDRILGARYALGDGTVVRTGGRVVKNVAGYAVHRLLCGSRGGLALLLEASLKLAPAPEARVALVYPADFARILDAARWAFLPRLEPAAVTVLGPRAGAGLWSQRSAEPEGFTVVIALEEDAAWVARQEAAIRDRLGEPMARLEGDHVVTVTARLADLGDQGPCRLSCTTSWNSPAALGVLAGDAAAASAVFHVLAGRLHVFPEPAVAVPLAAALEAGGFAVIDFAADAGGRPATGALASVAALRGRIRQALDPGEAWALGPAWEGGR
jgi:FAD/FMN-containing dehydrogenase